MIVATKDNIISMGSAIYGRISRSKTSIRVSGGFTTGGAADANRMKWKKQDIFWHKINYIWYTMHKQTTKMKRLPQACRRFDYRKYGGCPKNTGRFGDEILPGLRSGSCGYS